MTITAFFETVMVKKKLCSVSWFIKETSKKGIKRQEFSYMEPFGNSELHYSQLFSPEISGSQSFGLDLDDYTVSSPMFLGSQTKGILPVELDMEEKSNRKCKRLKLLSPTEQCVYVSIPESSSPLGLTLRKSSSFLDLVESKISESNAPFSILREVRRTDVEESLSQSNGKTKASNFSASLLRIGSWERVSRYDGELVAKCYFAKRKLVWEILDGGLKRKIEVLWSNIAALKATCENSVTQILEIELLTQPRFFLETNPQPRKHTNWKATTDFTDGQASVFRRQFVQFPKGTLQKHLEKLLQLDPRLCSLSKKPYPSMGSAFFGPASLESQNLNDQSLSGFEGLSSGPSKDLLMSESCDDYSKLLHCLKFIPRKHSDFDQTLTSSEILSHTLGASASCVDHGTSISATNTIPSLFFSLPSYTPNTNQPNLQEGFYSLETSTGEARTDVFGNLGATGVQERNFQPNDDLNSALDFKTNYWVSETQTNQNLVDELEDKGYIGEASYSVGDYSDFVEFPANISDTAPFPVFVMAGDEATLREVEDSVEWTLW